MTAQIVEAQRLGGALALVVAGADADRVDVALVVLVLRMLLGVAVDLAGGGLQHPRTAVARPLQQAVHADHAGQQRLHRIGLVVPRRGGAGEVVDAGGAQAGRQRLHHVGLDQREAAVVAHGVEILEAAGVQVVDADHAPAVADQAFAEIAAEEAGAAGDHCGARPGGSGCNCHGRPPLLNPPWRAGVRSGRLRSVAVPLRRDAPAAIGPGPGRCARCARSPRRAQPGPDRRWHRPRSMRSPRPRCRRRSGSPRPPAAARRGRASGR